MAALPREALRFAERMGVDLRGLEPEAQEIWQRLDALAAGDPEEYQRFVAEQLAAAAAAAPEDRDARAFRPTPGFVVATQVADARPVSDAARRVPLFVNVASSAAVAAPLDAGDAALTQVDAVAASLDLRVPLVVGPLRDLPADAGRAVDVVVHPVVVAAAGAHAAFRDAVAALALDSVAAETRLTLRGADAAVLDGVRYKGGLGAERDVPLLFHVSPTQRADAAPRPLASVQSLLSLVKAQDQASDEEATPPLLPPPPSRTPLIAEVTPSPRQDAIRDALDLRNATPDAVAATLEWVDAARGEAALVVDGLAATATPAALDIQVSPTELRLRCPRACLAAPPPGAADAVVALRVTRVAWRFDASDVRAAMRRKTHQLRVSFRLRCCDPGAA